MERKEKPESGEEGNLSDLDNFPGYPGTARVRLRGLALGGLKPITQPKRFYFANGLQTRKFQLASATNKRILLECYDR